MFEPELGTVCTLSSVRAWSAVPTTTNYPLIFQLPTAFELFNDVTGMNLDTGVSEEEFLQQIQEYEKEQAAYDLDSQRKEFAFDLMFERHRRDRSEQLESSSDGDEDAEDDADAEGNAASADEHLDLEEAVSSLRIDGANSSQRTSGV